MGMDRNTIIGFVLIGILMFGMLWFNSRDAEKLKQANEAKKRYDDSVAAARAKTDTAQLKTDTAKAAQQQAQAAAGNFGKYAIGTEQLTEVETEVMKISFTNKGGQPKLVQLKKFKKYDGSPLIIENGSFNNIGYKINSGNNSTAETGNLFFEGGTKTTNADKSITIAYNIKDSSGKEITHEYILKPGDYMLDFNIKMNGADKLVTGNTIGLNWQTQAQLQEKDLSYERQQAHICFSKDNSTDFEYVGSGDDKSWDKGVNWLALKQQFFITSVGSKNAFQGAAVKWMTPDDSLKIVAQAVADCKISLPAGNAANAQLQLFYGPSDYHLLKSYGNNMSDMVPYGNGIFSFVKYINRHFLLPVWEFLRNNISSYGIIILLLTLIIRLITSPILYKSYLSGAKMKVLKPEVDELKKKFTNAKTGEMDQQAFSMEQMKLWRSAGVSPLGGCLPALLQIPIFMSLFYFFQANVSLRGQSFLWAKDLASYDTIANLPFNIPFYGDHVSLFTITATITSFLISIYSMSNMQDNTNPVLKYMPYIFPVLMLFWFNSLPAALTWYYTVSNTITLILQIIIQKFIINPDKIKIQIEENKKKPVKQSGFAAKMQAMQEAQKKLQEQRNKQAKR